MVEKNMTYSVVNHLLKQVCKKPTKNKKSIHTF